MRKILLLLAITCFTIASHAALDGNGRRIAPEVEAVTTSFTTGSEENVYYLYNTSKKLFFTQGNTWGTRCCVGPCSSALKIYFDETGDGYVIHDYVQTKSQWMVACVSSDANTLYTDHDEWWGRPYWRVVPVSGNIFRLQNTQVDEGLYLGRDDALAQDYEHANPDIVDDNLRFPLSADLAPGEGHHIDWALISSDAYDAIYAVFAAYEAAEALYDLIAEAEKLGGIDLTAAKALYANEGATIEELNAAATALSEAIEERKEELDSIVPDIDLSSGAHFTITLTQPGTLQQRLTNAVFATDYDLVDFLTVKGKMGGADIAYLRAQEGLVSQLQYLDISQVELVYDDVEYYSYTYQTNWGSFGGIQTFQTNVYTLSSENKEEAGGGSFSGAMSNSTTIYRRNNLELALSGMQYLKQCKLPQSMKNVGANILSGCWSLEKVSLPSTLNIIENSAFSGTKIKSIDLPATVEFIGDGAFEGVPLSKIDVSHVTHLGERSLARTNLKTLELSNQLTAIPKGLFNGCGKLTSVTIPANVKTICDEAFAECGALTSFTIPDGVTEIGASAFSNCWNLNTVNLGNGVKKIGEKTFLGCNNLASVTISNSLEEIGDNAFGSIDAYDDGSDGFYCEIPWTQSLPVENGVLYIGKVALRYITGSTINIKEGTVSLTDWFGRNSSNITSITLPSTLRILGSLSLSNASISSIELPESLEKIGSSAFARCHKLRRITIPRNVSFIGDYAFGECGIIRVVYNAENASTYNPWNSDGTGNTYSRPFPESVTRVIIGEGVKVIPRYLFEGCKNLVRVTMASTVEYIGVGAFNTGGSPLQYIDLPSSLKYLGGSNFYGCNTVTAYMKKPFPLTERPSDEEVLNLEYVKRCIEEGDYYDGVEAVSTPFGGYIYYHYHIDEQGNLTWGEVTLSAPSSQDMEKPNTILRVPNGSLAAYKADPYWPSFFKEIVTFDGASDAEVINESTTVNVAGNVTDETDLSSALVDGIYVTLDTRDSGDGYSAEEGCLIINSQTTEEGIAAASADDADDLTVKNQLNGLMFEIPAGKGRITVDCQTLGSRALFIKIGDNKPQAVSLSTRNTTTVNFDVLMTTRVLVYAANNTQGTRSNSMRRRVAYANDDSVKLYGLSISIDELDEDGINTSTPAVSEGERAIYDLSGRKATNGLKKGLYIVNGKKVIRL